VPFDLGTERCRKIRFRSKADPTRDLESAGLYPRHKSKDMDDNWFEAERLHRAARDGDIEEMARLVASGVDMNLFDDISWTPLHYAVDCQHYKAAQWLLDNGSAVNAHELAKVGE